MDIANDQELVKIQISHLIKFADSFKGIEVHLPMNGKFVKFNYSEDQFIDILRKLQQKEVTEVWVLPSDCKKILDEIKESMSAKTFYDPKTSDEKRVESIDNSMKLVKNVINQLGVDTETVVLLKTINTRAMSLLNESPSIFSFVKRFKKNCSEEFLRSMLTSYVMSLMIDKFAWKSDLVKEKGALASLLCDVMLDKDDFNILRSWNKPFEELPDRIRSHPVTVSDKLRIKRNVIPAETITIIEQHHELPNGKGYPNGIGSNRFNQLSCIFIVSQQFIEALFDVNFDFEKRLEIINRLQRKYDSKAFEKALDSLVDVVGG